jgi:hypothetical protein
MYVVVIEFEYVVLVGIAVLVVDHDGVPMRWADIESPVDLLGVILFLDFEIQATQSSIRLAVQ